MRSPSSELSADQYTIEMWFCNCLPSDACGSRVYFLYDAPSVTGYLFSRGPDGAAGAPGDHLGIAKAGADAASSRLFFSNGTALRQVLTGTRDIHLKILDHNKELSID